MCSWATGSMNHQQSLLYLAVIFASAISLCESKYCTQYYVSSATCYRETRSTYPCGLFWLSRCNRYRRTSYQCTKTSSKSVCCPGYTGSGCIPVCHGQTSCPNGGTCYEPDECHCQTGFTGSRCEDINECSRGTSDCEQTCTNTHGSFKCSCIRGYILNSDVKTCQDVNECFSDNGGCEQICTNTGGSFQCGCRDGFVLDGDGQRCADINECSSSVTNCEQICYNDHGTYHCACGPGYTLAQDQAACDDIDECVEGTDNCDQLCHNTVGSFTCSCDPGYSFQENGNICQDINECLEHNGGCQQICVNDIGIYKCDCMGGFRLERDGKSCEDIDECEDGTSGCRQLCTNSVGSYECGCSDGYQLNDDLKSCYDIDECLEGTDNCDQLCHNTVGSFTCSCDPGYSFQDNGDICQDINECLEQNGGCQQICLNHIGIYKCDCMGGFRLERDDKSCEDIDECEDGTSGCRQLCTNNVGSYECGCSDGYQLNDDLKSCYDIDDCEDKVCYNKGTCEDKLSSYSCICTPGFTGDHCELDINECLVLNGGCHETCVNTYGSFACSCYGNQTLGSDGITCTGDSMDDTVFHRHKIPRKLLPRGCSIIELASCQMISDQAVVLSSTTDWYQSKKQRTVYFTFGIVFVESGPLSVPISLQGAKVTKDDWTFTVDNQVDNLEISDGIILDNTVHSSKNCLSLDLTVKDLFEFVNAGSFLRSYFKSILLTLPVWASIDQASDSMLDVSDMNTLLVYGNAINDIKWCNGAPVQSNHLYNVFLFNTNFALRIYGKAIKLPKSIRGERFCVIVDICQAGGGTFCIMLPTESRDILKETELFKQLYTEHGFDISPKGLCVSFTREVHVANDKTALALWNGDHLFQYPIISEANLWIGGGFKNTLPLLTVNGEMNMYLTVPSLDTILTAAFVDEWNILIDATLATGLRIPIKIFKNTVDIVLSAKGLVEGYSSIGNYDDRERCGEYSNPQGLFTSMKLDLSGTLNIFKGIPILEDWTIDASVSFYAFITSTLASDAAPNIIELKKDIVNIEEIFDAFRELLQGMVGQLIENISQHAHVILSRLIDASDTLKATLVNAMKSLEHGEKFSLSEIINGIWKDYLHVQSAAVDFTDETEFNAFIISYNTTAFFFQNMQRISESVEKAVSRVTRTTISNLKDYSSLGFKYKADISVISFHIGTVDIEIVFASEDLAICSRFSKAYELLKDERAVRFIGKLSDSVVLGFFLTSNVEEAGVRGAFSEVSSKFVVQLSAVVNILGTKTKTDLFINNNGLHIFFEAKVWNVFMARLEMCAAAGKNWYDLTYNVHGIFVVDVDNKSPRSSFQLSYLNGLKNVVKQMADGTDRRISAVQTSVSKAKEGVKKAQQWLNDKQESVRNAKDAFDNAVAKLDNAKRKLDQTRETFRKGEKKLIEAQKDIDNLCRIKYCKPICIPGIRCKLCFSGRFPYPCCRWIRCMIQIFNLICEAANIFCRILRAVAFGILEIAKLVVRAEMVAFDVAKAAVSVAQVVVEKSRVALTLAEGVLELAKVGLDGVNGVLEAAKVALDVVKNIIKGEIQVLEYVISIGLQSIIDVRICEFNVEISTRDLAVFDVGCEVNAFRLGWKKIQMRINFKNVLQTIWQAAKATINAIVNGFEEILGRRKRYIAFVSNSKMHTILRSVRETSQCGENITTESIMDTIIIKKELGETTDDDYGNRIQLFLIKCAKMTNILLFLTESFEILYDIANETKTYMDNATALKAELQQFDLQSISENMTLQNNEVDVDFATSEYNMTQADLDKILQYAKNNVSSDQLMLESASAVSLSSNAIDEELSAAESVKIMNQWILVMENYTNDYFNESECYRFQDCVYHSIFQLYDLYSYEEIPNMQVIQLAILELEDKILEIFQNTSETIQTTYDASSSVMANIQVLSDTNLFCSTAPTFTNEPENKTVAIGDTLVLNCVALAGPIPVYWWLKNDELLTDRNATLEVHNVSMEDGGVYMCMAGNVVANITSKPAVVTVVDQYVSTEAPDVMTDITEEESETAQSYTVVIVTTTTGGVLALLAIAGFVVWRYRKRTRNQPYWM